jgi:sulfite reductase alpha subunit-like flavoprotein
MEIIKHNSCNNRVKLLLIPTYSITNYKLNSTLRITKQQIIQLLWQHNNKIYSISSKQKKARLTIKINGNN